MSKQIELELYIFATTPKAIMVGREAEDELDEIWLPKRAVDLLEGYEFEDSVEPIPMLVTEVLALKKGLI